MKHVVPIAVAAMLAACTVQDNPNREAPANPSANAPQPAPVEPAAPAAPQPSPPPPQIGERATPSPPTGPREVVSEAPFTSTSAQGAANVVQTYYALIEARKYVEAHELWGPSSDLADKTFAAPFAAYREYHAEVYAPGAIEGAAGSLYVEVPVKIYGVTTKGERFETPGTVTLRRVNNVDGSTAEQRRWHITTIDTPPQPH